MTEKAPATWHFWLIAVASLLWNAFGGYDYTMTQTNNAAYLAAFTPEQREYFASFPTWMEAAWACGVWGAVAGSILLLLRSRYAFEAFALSLAGLAVSSIYQFGLSPVSATDIMGTSGTIITVVIWIVAIALLWYAHRQRSNRVIT